MVTKRRSIYLAGPMGLVTEDEAKGWRDRATLLLDAIGIDTIDPFNLHPEARKEMKRIKGHTEEIATAIVEGDLKVIEECDAVLVNTCKPGWGTAMEIMYSFNTRTPVFAFATPSPAPLWLMYHVGSEIYVTMEEAINSIDVTFNNELIKQREQGRL